MLLKAAYQNLLHLILLMVIGFGSWQLLAPKVAFQAQGILLPASKAMPNYHTNPQDIMILQNLPPQTSAKKLGTIRATLHFSQISNQADKENAEKIVAKARTLASNYGANAIVVNYIGRTSKVDQLDQMSLEAIAYDIQKPLI